MALFTTIGTIARFESKTLLRGWFFRIFSILAIGFIFFFNLFGFTDLGGGGWPGRLAPGSVPYINLFFLNLSQAIIAVFLSSDFLGRDKKLDTTESFYVRDMSNFGYVIGKMTGILKVFLLLNGVVLLIGLIFNLIADDVVLIPQTYLIYPLLISLPTLLFVLGLSFFLMVVIRNQAVTFILMLGLIGISLFYFSDKAYGVFDLIGFFTPYAYSGFSGYHNLSELVMLRAGYGLLGVSFIFLTIALLPRLPQERWFVPKMVTSTLATLIPALLLLFFYWHSYYQQSQHRIEFVQLDSTLPIEPAFSIESNSILLEHEGEKVKVTSQMALKRVANSEIATMQLILNPGFEISALEIEGRPVKYDRTHHLITINEPLRVDDELIQVLMVYSGKPMAEALYTDIPDEDYKALNRRDPLVNGKAAFFVEEEFVLLTRESGWYPRIASNNYRSVPGFTHFTLEVVTDKALTPLSQGEYANSSTGKWKFESSQPLNALSVVIGKYHVEKVQADSVEFAFYAGVDNKQLFRSFDLISDTLPQLLTDLKREAERKLGLDYPFARFSVVEVPVHFYTYMRQWTLATEDNQPEMVFVPEMGGGIWGLDMKQQKRRVEDEGQENKQNFTPREIQVQVFKNVTGNLFLNQQDFFFRRPRSQRSVPGWGKQHVFPQFFCYTNEIYEPHFPLLQFISENYLFSRIQGSTGSVSTNTADDQVILLMRGKSLRMLLDSVQSSEKVSTLLAMKGNQLFNSLKAGAEHMDVNSLLDNLFKNNRFKSMSRIQFIEQLSDESKVDFKEILDQWSNDSELPAYLIGKTQAYEVKEGSYIRYFTRIHLSNVGRANGIVTIGLRDQVQERRTGFSRRGRNEMEPSIEKSVIINSGQSVEIGFLSNGEPRELIVNTYVSENIPISQRVVINDIQKNGNSVFEGARVVNTPVRFNEPYETIVDNEDTGFKMVNSSERKTLKDWWMGRDLEKSDKYVTLWRNIDSPRWQYLLDDAGFGKFIRSVVFKHSGTGDSYAQWTANLPESGNYSVYAYVPDIQTTRSWRGEKDEGKFTYIVVHDDGETPVEVGPVKDQNGWVYLGDFYLSAGDAIVKLSDKSTHNVVMADAVKWAKK